MKNRLLAATALMLFTTATAWGQSDGRQPVVSKQQGQGLVTQTPLSGDQQQQRLGNDEAEQD